MVLIESYEAVQSVTKACEYFSQKVNERKNICAFYFPIILIEGKLFEGQLSVDNDISIQEVRNTEVLVTRSFHQYGNSHILIFDSSNLDQISQELNDLATEFFEKYNRLLEKRISPKSEPPYGWKQLSPLKVITESGQLIL